MKVLLNTDNHIEGREKLQAEVESVVESALEHFVDRLTRVEVYLGDENSKKGGDNDKRCTMEARIEGRPPAAATHHAGNLSEAIEGAADKLQRALQHDLGRLSDRS